jgi:Tol biopolymer transport system component
MGSTEHNTPIRKVPLPNKILSTLGSIQFDRLDMAVIGVMMFSIVAIGVMMLVGSTVGVQIKQYSPESLASSQDIIRIEFNVPIDKSTAQEHFSIAPTVEGRLEWIGDRQLQYIPDLPLSPDEDYTVTLSAGVEDSDHSLELKDDFQFRFRVKMPSIVYVGFGAGGSRNLYKFDLENSQTTQLTNAPNGINDYDISSDGKWVAYSSPVAGQLYDIWAFNLDNQQLIQVTNCAQAQGSCFDPTWRPDNRQLAYTRRDIDTDTGLGISEHVWLVDFATLESRLLFDDVTVESRAPQWSPVGERIAVYFLNPQGVYIQDFQSGEGLLIPTEQGIVGAFSPDGNSLVYPVLVQGALGPTYYTHLEIARFEQLGVEDPEGLLLSGEREAAVEDIVAAFHPDGRHIAVSRRYLDSNYTEGTQIYLLDLTTMEAQPLVVDSAYSHGAIRWSPDGSLLLMQRYRFASNRNNTEIWMYQLQTGELTRLVNDGFAPQFLPE